MLTKLHLDLNDPYGLIGKESVKGRVGAHAVAAHRYGCSSLATLAFEPVVEINLLSWDTGPL